MFASESGRGTHLSWALTPANWWVAREEAIVTGGGWGVGAEVSRARRAASGSFAAHSRREKTHTHFSGLLEGVTSERAKWHAIAQNGRRRSVFAPDSEAPIASSQFDFANVVTAKVLRERKIHESIQKSRLDAIRFDRLKKNRHSEPLSPERGAELDAPAHR